MPLFRFLLIDLSPIALCPRRAPVDWLIDCLLYRYIEWASHEPQETVYDFSGMLNFTEYCRLAQNLGLNVIIRFGPFIASERDGVSGENASHGSPTNRPLTDGSSLLVAGQAPENAIPNNGS